LGPGWPGQRRPVRSGEGPASVAAPHRHPDRRGRGL